MCRLWSFQAVPDVEPEADKSEGEEESEEYTGPICEKCVHKD